MTSSLSPSRVQSFLGCLVPRKPQLGREKQSLVRVQGVMGSNAPPTPPKKPSKYDFYSRKLLLRKGVRVSAGLDLKSTLLGRRRHLVWDSADPITWGKP